MQVRVFEAADMASGLKMVKKELGPDALILSTRTIRTGKLGLMGKPLLEITAAIDSDYPRETRSKQLETPAPPQERFLSRGKREGGFRRVVGDSVETFLGQREAIPSASCHPPPKDLADTMQAPPDKSQSALQNEVDELKDLVKNLAARMTQLSEKEEPAIPGRQLKVKDSNFGPRFDSTAIHGDHILSLLVERGINVETSRTIAGFLRESHTDRELGSQEIVQSAISRTIADLIQVNPPPISESQGQQRIALVGPTGVGKTTTLAKIAAAYLSRQSNSIALITIDTYRIAAVEQLKVYGEIMNLPVEVVITPEQLEKAIARHSDKELILIDTAGRSPRDSYCINELADFLRADFDIDKHLVLSATTREHELLDAVERFQTLGITHTIFTKIDECANLGILLNVQIQNANPLSYLANGQRVPEDLLEATPAIVAELIMSQTQGSMHD